jgi:hypothetical protein
MLSFILSWYRSSSHFSSFLKLYFKNQTIMNEHKHKIFVTFVFFMIISHVNIVVVTLQKIAYYQHYNVMVTMLVFIMETNEVTREKIG